VVAIGLSVRSSLRVSDAEDALHQRRLPLALGAFPVAVDVGGDLEARVAEVAGEPGDLATGFERPLGEGVPERMEGALLAGRTDARDVGAGQGRVELPSQDRRGDEVARARVAGKDERLVFGSSELAPPGSEEGDDVGGEVDVPALVVLGRLRWPSVIVRRTRTIASARSTSAQVRARSSPWRMPVLSANWKRVVKSPAGTSAKRRGSSSFSK